MNYGRQVTQFGVVAPVWVDENWSTTPVLRDPLAVFSGSVERLYSSVSAADQSKKQILLIAG